MTMLNGPRDNNSMQRTALSATADAERYNVNEAQEGTRFRRGNGFLNVLEARA
jgi:hypothetical protein